MGRPKHRAKPGTRSKTEAQAGLLAGRCSQPPLRVRTSGSSRGMRKARTPCLVELSTCATASAGGPCLARRAVTLGAPALTGLCLAVTRNESEQVLHRVSSLLLPHQQQQAASRASLRWWRPWRRAQTATDTAPCTSVTRTRAPHLISAHPTLDQIPRPLSPVPPARAND